MTKNQVRALVEGSSIQRLREVLDGLERLRRRVPLDNLPAAEQRFLLDLRDHEEFFRSLADAKLHNA
jgi:hypothetical protein